MSAFKELKTVSFSTGTPSRKQEELVRFHEREGSIFILLSDLWRLCRMTGDKGVVVGLYVRAMGKDAAQHFIFKGASQEDALVSREVARRMVQDWTKDAEESVFHQYPIEHMFEEARRGMHGLEILRAIFERLGDARSPAHFDAIELSLEVDMVARAILTNWGRPRSGFPPLDVVQSRFLRGLTMPPGDFRKAKRSRDAALWFLDERRETVLAHIQPQKTTLRIKSD